MENEKILGVDVDGVLADITSVLKLTAEDILDVPRGSLPQPATWGFKEWGVEMPVLLSEGVLRYDMFQTCEPMEGSVDVLSDLREDGWHIRIITHRGATHKTERRWLKILGKDKHWLREQTLQWLASVEIPYDDIFFSQNKAAVEADIAIDDDPNNIRNYSKHGKPSIMFLHPHNIEAASDMPDDVFTAENWHEISEIAAKWRERNLRQ